MFGASGLVLLDGWRAGTAPRQQLGPENLFSPSQPDELERGTLNSPGHARSGPHIEQPRPVVGSPPADPTSSQSQSPATTSTPQPSRSDRSPMPQGTSLVRSRRIREGPAVEDGHSDATAAPMER
jgi:hypothetical protein